ncbi:hydroxymethylglutaryl-CoA lyase [Acuticoccus sediminis]|uniref:Hydroxymethylglutaryl-CoA lyase n=1 Tax=Acuticoccus sediminis TaxID=2184697 RepID=A0A8B2NQE5_9HYPH|nr:hydroxymethylglutaryl-CoA lyase [Acuticoccus sediminis]RAH99233.1 hydroxymethylglutaryl-CoA lyase [Acuticoccus sediminis]
MREDILVREVGLRDGLQLVPEMMPTERKIEWMTRSAAAGVREIEVTSFVPAKIIPQFADADDVAAAALADASFLASVLAVNFKGAVRAFDAGFRKINTLVSASETHSLANVRRTRAEAVDAFRAMIAEREARGLAGEVTIACCVATAFGCTLQGEVPERDVVDLARQVAEAGADEIMIADTVGYADPLRVGRLMRAVAAEIGDLPILAHFHDTRGLGLANVVAAVEAGVRRFDASLGGLGGCPFAPGATGNIDTEDTVYLLETMGFDTGIDLDALLALRTDLEAWLPGQRLGGAVHRAGVPKLPATYPTLVAAE